MSTEHWFVFVGGLLVAMGLSHGAIRRLPITTSIVYLAVGVLVGPTAFHLFHFNPLEQSALLEVLTEIAVLISLYAAGVKLPAPWTMAGWRAPILLATISMVVTVGLVAAFAMAVLDLSLGLAVLLGAVLAPTDPVLASEVQTRHSRDRDPLRFNLSCEAGINDGSAFPFVMLGLGLLGLHDLGESGLRWIALDVLWAIAAAVIVGLLAGVGLAKVVWALEARDDSHTLMHDFIALGMIGAVAGLCEVIHAWGFLAVFFGAVALRQTENQLRGIPATEAETSTPADPPDDARRDRSGMVSEGSLVFKEHLERLSELLLVVLLGGSLFLDSWSWRAVALALFLFFAARPASVLIGLLFARPPRRTTAMIAWFGIRGIGSLFYLMFAIQHGLPEEQALELIHFTLVVVALSIVIHGISAKLALRKSETQADQEEK